MGRASGGERDCHVFDAGTGILPCVRFELDRRVQLSELTSVPCLGIGERERIRVGSESSQYPFSHTLSSSPPSDSSSSVFASILAV